MNGSIFWTFIEIYQIYSVGTETSIFSKYSPMSSEIFINHLSYFNMSFITIIITDFHDFFISTFFRNYFIGVINSHEKSIISNMHGSHVAFIDIFKAFFICIIVNRLDIIFFIFVDHSTVTKFDHFWVTHYNISNKFFYHLLNFLVLLVIVFGEISEVYFFGFIQLYNIICFVGRGGQFY